MKVPRKFGGRPKRELEPGERVHLGFRVTPELKDRVERAAQASGRSLSQESEFRLEFSFHREDLLEDALKLAYGREVTGVLMYLGYVMDLMVTWASMRRAAESDGRMDWNLSLYARNNWASDPFMYDMVMEAAETLIQLLRAARPEGEGRPRSDEEDANTAQALSSFMRGAICDPLGQDSMSDQLRSIRSFLGPIADRLQELNK